MGIYENLLPGKENALTPEYLTVKCHFFPAFECFRSRSKAERKAGKVILSVLLRRRILSSCSRRRWKSESLFVRENRGENTLRVLEVQRELLEELEGDKN